eukprot:gene8461-10392_t
MDTYHSVMYARLNSKFGWIGVDNDDDDGQYLIAGSDSLKKIKEIHTRGCGDLPMWITSFTLEYLSQDSGEFIPYENKKIFPANKDQNTTVIHIIEPPIITKSVKLIPLTWYNKPSLRFEVLYQPAIINNSNNNNVFLQSGVVKYGVVVHKYKPSYVQYYVNTPFPVPFDNCASLPKVVVSLQNLVNPLNTTLEISATSITQSSFDLGIYAYTEYIPYELSKVSTMTVTFTLYRIQNGIPFH